MAGTHRSGRKRKPTALHALHGTRIRQTRSDEAVVPAAAPTIPPHIEADPRALAAWHRHVADLRARRLLTPAFGDLLAALAMTSADVERTREMLALMNFTPVVTETMPDAGGKLRTRIRANVVRREFERLLRLQATLLSEFGLTPTASAKASTIGASSTEDDFTSWERSRPTVLDFSPVRARRP